MSSISCIETGVTMSAENNWDEAMCAICRDPYLEVEDYGIHTSLGCGCHYHFSCLLHYIRSKLGNRVSMEIMTKEGQKIGKGIVCPKFAIECCPMIEPRYSITRDEFLLLRDFGNERNCPDTLNEHDLDKIERWIFSEDEEEPQSEESNSSSIVDETDDEQPLNSDELIIATTKACPTCNFRVMHAHGHQCHHINPGYGCLRCKTEFCFKCLGTANDNLRSRGNKSSCFCGHWSNFCSPIRSSDDINKFLSLTPYPVDIRCGCAVCSECRPRRPCSMCHGSCAVCQGVIPPGPLSLSKEDISAFKTQLEMCKRRIDALRDRPTNVQSIITVNNLMHSLRTACINGNWTSFQQAIDSYTTQQMTLFGVERQDIVDTIMRNIKNFPDNAGRNLLHYAVHSTSRNGVSIAQCLIDQYNVSVLAFDTYGSTPMYYLLDACIAMTRRFASDLPDYLLILLGSMFRKAGFDYLFHSSPNHGESISVYSPGAGCRVSTRSLGTFSGMKFKEWIFTCPNVLRVIIETFPYDCYQMDLQFYACSNLALPKRQQCMREILDGWNAVSLATHDSRFNTREVLLTKYRGRERTLLSMIAEELTNGWDRRTIADRKYSNNAELEFFTNLLRSVFHSEECDSNNNDESDYQKRIAKVKLLKQALPVINGGSLKDSLHEVFLFRVLYDFDNIWLQDLLDDIDIESMVAEQPTRSLTLLHVACYKPHTLMMQSIIHDLLKDPRSGFERCNSELTMDDDEDDDDYIEIPQTPITPQRGTCWLRQRDPEGYLPIQALLLGCSNYRVESDFPKHLFLSIFYATGKERIIRMKIKGMSLLDYCASNAYISTVLLKSWSDNSNNQRFTFDPRLLAFFPMELIWKLVFSMNDFIFTCSLMTSLSKRCDTLRKKKQALLDLIPNVKEGVNSDNGNHNSGEEENEDVDEIVRMVFNSCWLHHDQTMNIRGLSSYIERLFRRSVTNEQTPQTYALIRWMLREPLFLGGCVMDHSFATEQTVCLRGTFVLKWLFEAFDEEIFRILLQGIAETRNLHRDERRLLLQWNLFEAPSSTWLSYSMFPTEEVAIKWFGQFVRHCSNTALHNLCNAALVEPKSILLFCCNMGWYRLFDVLVEECSHVLDWRATDVENKNNTLLHAISLTCANRTHTPTLDWLTSETRSEIFPLWKIQNVDGDTALHILARNRPEVIPRVLDLYAGHIDINIHNNSGDNILSSICSSCLSNKSLSVPWILQAMEALGKANESATSSIEREVLFRPNNHGVLPILQLIDTFGFSQLPPSLLDNFMMKMQIACESSLSGNDCQTFDINTLCDSKGDNLLRLAVRAADDSLFHNVLTHFADTIRFDVFQQTSFGLKNEQNRHNYRSNSKYNVLHMITHLAHQADRIRFLEVIINLVKSSIISPSKTRLYHSWLQKDHQHHLPFMTVEYLQYELLQHRNVDLFSVTVIDHQGKNLLHHLLITNSKHSFQLFERLVEWFSATDSTLQQLSEALNEVDNDGNNPLMIAINIWNVEMIRLILSTLLTNLDVSFTNYVDHTAESSHTKSVNKSTGKSDSPIKSSSKKKEKRSLREILLNCFKDAKQLRKLIMKH